MKVNSYLPVPVASPHGDHEKVAPIQPVAQSPDPVRDQRRATKPLVVSQQERQYAKTLLSNHPQAAVRDAQEPRARRALEAYKSVATTQEREYVRRVLGFNEFA